MRISYGFIWQICFFFLKTRGLSNRWLQTMAPKEREIITDLKKCDFRPMYAYFVEMSEKRKAMPKGEKQKIKEVICHAFFQRP